MCAIERETGFRMIVLLNAVGPCVVAHFATGFAELTAVRVVTPVARSAGFSTGQRMVERIDLERRGFVAGLARPLPETLPVRAVLAMACNTLSSSQPERSSPATAARPARHMTRRARYRDVRTGQLELRAGVPVDVERGRRPPALAVTSAAGRTAGGLRKFPLVIIEVTGGATVVKRTRERRVLTAAGKLDRDSLGPPVPCTMTASAAHSGVLAA
jgi:hypothetical protein